MSIRRPVEQTTTAAHPGEGERPSYAGQNADSSSSISERSVASAMARSAVIFGSTVRAKNCAAATLPS